MCQRQKDLQDMQALNTHFLTPCLLPKIDVYNTNKPAPSFLHSPTILFPLINNFRCDANQKPQQIYWLPNGSQSRNVFIHLLYLFIYFIYILPFCIKISRRLQGLEKFLLIRLLLFNLYPPVTEELKNRTADLLTK